VITNIEDLARWDEVFYKDKIGGKGFSDLLLTQGRLNSGEILRYAFGLEIYEYKGHKVIEHGLPTSGVPHQLGPRYSSCRQHCLPT